MEIKEAGAIAEKYERFTELEGIWKDIRSARIDINYDSDEIHLGFVKRGEQFKIPLPRLIADETVAKIESMIEEEMLRLKEEIDHIEVNMTK